MSEDFKNKGNDAYKKQQYDKALTFYTKAIELTPTEPTYYTNRASVFLVKENYKAALNDCLQALRINENHFRALMRAGKCYMLLGNLPQAQNLYFRADKVQPNDPSIVSELKELGESQQNYDSCEDFLKLNNFQQALYYIERLIEKCNGSLEFKLKKIELLILNGDLKKCGEMCLMVDNQFGNSSDLKYFRGKCAYYMGNVPQAEKILKETLQYDQDFSKARVFLKQIKESENQKEQANQLFSSGQNQEAIEAYTNCLKLDAHNKNYNSIILSNRAACYMKKNDYVKALTDINKAIDLNPDYIKAYARRGNIKVQLEDYEEAIKDYHKVKEMNSNYPDIDNLLSSAQANSRQRKRKDYYKILEIEKNATNDQIKKAYRKAALKWHPDKNSETEEQKREAEKMFKDVSEANSILSDPNKRSIYDSGQDPNSMGSMGGVDPTQIFNMFFGGGESGGFSSMFGGSGSGGGGGGGFPFGNGARVFMSSSGGPGFSSGGGFPGFGGNNDSNDGGFGGSFGGGFPFSMFSQGGKQNKRK